MSQSLSTAIAPKGVRQMDADRIAIPSAFAPQRSPARATARDTETFGMTEFKRTLEELVNLEGLLGSLTGDSSTPAPERWVAFSAAKVSCCTW